MRWFRPGILLVVVILFMIGCSRRENAPAPDPTLTALPTQAVPLTGLATAATATTVLEQNPSNAPNATVLPNPQSLTSPQAEYVLQAYPVPDGSHPHDVAPAPDGSVWYTAQATGELGRLDPSTGETHHISLGEGSSPHGVIVGPDGAPWITDGGLNAIVRVDLLQKMCKYFRFRRILTGRT